MKSKIGLDLPTRRQPGRAARPEKLVFDDSSSSEPKPSSGAGTRKRTTRASDELPEPKRVKAKNRGPERLLIDRLEARISKMDSAAALSEQSELLNVGRAKQPVATPEPTTPGSVKSKRSRPRKRRAKEELYMDEFLASDAEEVKETQAQPIPLRRGDRWIPEIEHRRRVTKRPSNVPSQVWISYCLLDDYIYRNSLSDEEVLKLPFLDDVLDFQMGRGQPVALEGYHWNSKKHLVPIPEPARGAETEVPTLPRLPTLFDT
ncbi:hypothetical protein Hte_005808 [Hypoxylon texense]